MNLPSVLSKSNLRIARTKKRWSGGLEETSYTFTMNRIPAVDLNHPQWSDFNRTLHITALLIRSARNLSSHAPVGVAGHSPTLVQYWSLDLLDQSRILCRLQRRLFPEQQLPTGSEEHVTVSTARMGFQHPTHVLGRKCTVSSSGNNLPETLMKLCNV